MIAVNKWFIYTFEGLFVILAILKSMDICIANHWGYMSDPLNFRQSQFKQI